MTQIDERYLYVFVRQDLPLAQQIVQASHAVYSLVSLSHPTAECPNIVVVGLPHLKSLNRALSKLKKHQIPHYAWSEPDYDFGMTAIATAPLDMEQRKVLQQYRVWRAQSSNGVDGMSLSQPAANAQVAQSQSTSL